MVELIKNPFKESSASKGFLQNVNRAAYDNNREFVTSGIWDIQFTKVPDAPFFPGSDLISNRVLDVKTPEPFKPNLLEHKMRGFTKLQPNSRTNKSGDITLEFTDYEDRTIIAWIKSWAELQSDPTTNLGVRSEFLKCNLKITRFNTSGNALDEYLCYSGFLKSWNFNNGYTNEQALIPVQSFTLGFEFLQFNQLNK